MRTLQTAGREESDHSTAQPNHWVIKDSLGLACGTEEQKTGLASDDMGKQEAREGETFRLALRVDGEKPGQFLETPMRWDQQR